MTACSPPIALELRNVSMHIGEYCHREGRNTYCAHMKEAMRNHDMLGVTSVAQDAYLIISMAKVL